MLGDGAGTQHDHLGGQTLLMPQIGSQPTFRLYNEDCFSTFARLSAGCVDLVLVDPPYGTTQCRWDEVIPLDRMWSEVRRVIRPTGACLVMAVQPFTSILITSNLSEFRYVWVWNKINRITGHLNAKKQPLRITEDIVAFYKSQPQYHPIKIKGETYRASSGNGSGLYGSQSRVPMTEVSALDQS